MPSRLVVLLVAALNLVAMANGCGLKTFGKDVEALGAKLLAGGSMERNQGHVSYLMDADLYAKVHATETNGWGYIEYRMTTYDVTNALMRDVEAQVEQAQGDEAKFHQVDEAQRTHAMDCDTVRHRMRDCSGMAQFETVDFSGVQEAGLKAMAQAYFCGVMKQNGAAVSAVYEHLRAKYQKPGVARKKVPLSQLLGEGQ